MKKLMILVTMFIMLVTVNPAFGKTVARETIGDYTISAVRKNNTIKIKWNGKTIHTYRNFKGKVKILPERKLTAKMLTSRKNKVIYIERVVGVITDDNLNGITTGSGYTHYRRSLKGIGKKGDIVVSYCVYSPFKNTIDDYDERYDIIL